LVQASHVLDRIEVTADDVSLVADAGLVLPATLGQRLGLAELLDARVSAGANAADKCLTVIHSALAGGDCIDDVAALRAGATQAVLGHRAVAPSTVGTFLRSMSWGHARQLDAVSRELLARAATAGAVALDPAAGPVVLDIDATLVETYGLAKSGARQVMRTGRRGYHPLLAVLGGDRPGTGDVLHARLRRGRSNDATGAASFLAESICRLRGAGAAGPVVLRADSGFYLADILTVCARHQVGFSLGARMIGRMRAVIAAIDEQQWTELPYFEPGAAVAEIGWLAFDREHRRTPHRDGRPARHRGAGTWVRLIVRRTPTPPQIRARRQTAGQQELFPSYDYHPFITDQPGDPVELDRFHRAHAEVELAIRDLKYGLGLNHLPTGRFGANHAWLILQTIAHNLGRWTARLGDLAATPRQTIKTLRRRYLTVPARLIGHARRHRLRLPTHWPWTDPLLAALARLRALPAPAD
jgi:hypothetical protein